MLSQSVDAEALSYQYAMGFSEALPANQIPVVPAALPNVFLLFQGLRHIAHSGHISTGAQAMLDSLLHPARELFNGLLQPSLVPYPMLQMSCSSDLLACHSALESGRTITLSEKGGEVVVAAPGFRIVATMNPGGDYGKRELSPALGNRFTQAWIPSVHDSAELLAILESRMTGATPHYEIRKYYQSTSKAHFKIPQKSLCTPAAVDLLSGSQTSPDIMQGTYALRKAVDQGAARLLYDCVADGRLHHLCTEIILLQMQAGMGQIHGRNACHSPYWRVPGPRHLQVQS